MVLITCNLKMKFNLTRKLPGPGPTRNTDSHKPASEWPQVSSLTFLRPQLQVNLTGRLGVAPVTRAVRFLTFESALFNLKFALSHWHSAA